MVLNLLSSLVGALPEGLALVLGVGAAGWLFATRSRPAGIALGVGLALLAAYLLLEVVATPALGMVSQLGVLPGDLLMLAYPATHLIVNGVHGLAIVAVLIAICLGPAPARLDEAS